MKPVFTNSDTIHRPKGNCRNISLLHPEEVQAKSVIRRVKLEKQKLLIYISMN